MFPPFLGGSIFLCTFPALTEQSLQKKAKKCNFHALSCACAVVCVQVRVQVCMCVRVSDPHAHTCVEVCMRRRTKLCYSHFAVRRAYACTQSPQGRRRSAKPVSIKSNTLICFQKKSSSSLHLLACMDRGSYFFSTVLFRATMCSREHPSQIL